VIDIINATGTSFLCKSKIYAIGARERTIAPVCKTNLYPTQFIRFIQNVNAQEIGVRAQYPEAGHDFGNPNSIFRPPKLFPKKIVKHTLS